MLYITIQTKNENKSAKEKERPPNKTIKIWMEFIDFLGNTAFGIQNTLLLLILLITEKKAWTLIDFQLSSFRFLFKRKTRNKPQNRNDGWNTPGEGEMFLLINTINFFLRKKQSLLRWLSIWWHVTNSINNKKREETNTSCRKRDPPN